MQNILNAYAALSIALSAVPQARTVEEHFARQIMRELALGDTLGAEEAMGRFIVAVAIDVRKEAVEGGLSAEDAKDAQRSISRARDVLG